MMANSTIRFFGGARPGLIKSRTANVTHDPSRANGLMRLAQSFYRDAIHDALEVSEGAEAPYVATPVEPVAHLAFLSRCVLLQVIGGAGLWAYGSPALPKSHSQAKTPCCAG
jgi:hypothetical protein